MSTGKPWREGRADALLAAMSDLGMSMSRSAAGELIDERVQFVATQIRVTPRTARSYLTDEAIAGLAKSMAFDFVEETPGADLLTAPRNTTISMQLAGHTIAGLAEAVRIRLAEREDLEHARVVVTQLAQAQASLGLVMADQTGPIIDGQPSIRVPRSLLHRIARYLEAAADLVEDGVIGFGTDPADSRGLPDAFRRDADLLRAATNSEP